MHVWMLVSPSSLCSRRGGQTPTQGRMRQIQDLARSGWGETGLLCGGTRNQVGARLLRCSNSQRKPHWCLPKKRPRKPSPPRYKVWRNWGGVVGVLWVGRSGPILGGGAWEPDTQRETRSIPRMQPRSDRGNALMGNGGAGRGGGGSAGHPHTHPGSGRCCPGGGCGRWVPPSAQRSAPPQRRGHRNRPPKKAAEAGPDPDLVWRFPSAARPPAAPFPPPEPPPPPPRSPRPRRATGGAGGGAAVKRVQRGEWQWGVDGV